jgi:hypothetical protein
MLDLKGEETIMNAIQIKDEIRKLNRSNKLEIFRWIDREIADNLVCRIGTDRSLQIRQEIEQKCEVTSPGRRVHLGNAEQASADCDEQAINKRRSQSGMVSTSAH